MNALVVKARRASLNLSVNLPVKIWNIYFNYYYGSEVLWPTIYQGHTSLDTSQTEKMHQELCKDILKGHRNTANLVCGAELAEFLLSLAIIKRALKFHSHLSQSHLDSYHHTAYLNTYIHPETDFLQHIKKQYHLHTNNQHKTN